MTKLIKDKTIKIIIKKDLPYGPLLEFYMDDELIHPKYFDVIEDSKKQLIFEFGNPTNPKDFLED